MYSGTMQSECSRWLTRAAAVLLAFMMLLAAGGTVLGASDEERATEIAKQIKCPVCQNVPVAYSQSELAGEMRTVIREMVERGESDQAIIQYFVERYGEDVLLEPPRRGFGLWLWLVSVGVLVMGTGVVGVVLWNWTHARAGQPAPAAAAMRQGARPAAELDERFEEEFRAFKQGKRS